MRKLIFVAVIFSLIIFGCAKAPPKESITGPIILSQPMSITEFGREQGFQMQFVSKSIAFDSACSVDEDCTYVQNPVGRKTAACINLNNANDSGLIIDKNISCICKPLVFKAPSDGNFSVMTEDEGVLTCQVKKKMPDLSVKITAPESSRPDEEAIFNVSIKNIGPSACSNVNVLTKFGDSSESITKMSWCAGLGYAIDECDDMGFEPFLLPGETAIASIGREYNSTGTFNVSVYVHCEEEESNYKNNYYNITFVVS